MSSDNDFFYSSKYYDDKYEYRHVVLPKDYAHKIPKDHLMSEAEWRALGVRMTPGWIHYMIHEPERHILLFRRLISGSKAPPSQEEQFRAEKTELLS